jgi:hypothetical protein
VIRVARQEEPADFDAKVRRPGLASGSKLKPTWRNCLDELAEAYAYRCAYLAFVIPPGTGARSVEHFRPKSRYRELAYEWSNYRLVCALLNGRKADHEDVLDPCEVHDGWFRLRDMASLEVEPALGLPPDVTAAVVATIQRLRLNSPACVEARAFYWRPYLDKGLSLSLLEEWSPFVAREARRLGALLPEDLDPSRLEH